MQLAERSAALAQGREGHREQASFSFVQVSDQKQWQELMDRIHGHLQMLKRYVYSKHVTARVEKPLIAGNSMSKVGSVRW